MNAVKLGLKNHQHSCAHNLGTPSTSSARPREEAELVLGVPRATSFRLR